ncbi:hypothetical protein [Fusobacterium sp.]|uniref:hypothetical protein n=1 Tax=Fusobacterium sp. TaxID=68766 RepID=UPI00290009E2|nr:hypothetical protein [Fusobacterium sp.]MDU1912509.1 hypothetical protein [Fusobacterium sp.]
MRQEIIDHLKNEYKKLKLTSKKLNLKYSYLFNNVEVNIYFDNFDEDLPTVTLILKYKKLYYFRPFNFNDNNYLRRIPSEILEKLLVENRLDEFYDTLEKKLTGDYKVANYEKDYLYKNTVKFQENNFEINPFFHHLRNVRMTDDQKELLNIYLNISIETLNYIQNRRFTVITTEKIEQRCRLKDEMERVLI